MSWCPVRPRAATTAYWCLSQDCNSEGPGSDDGWRSGSSTPFPKRAKANLEVMKRLHLSQSTTTTTSLQLTSFVHMPAAWGWAGCPLNHRSLDRALSFENRARTTTTDQPNRTRHGTAWLPLVSSCLVRNHRAGKLMANALLSLLPTVASAVSHHFLFYHSL